MILSQNNVKLSHSFLWSTVGSNVGSTVWSNVGSTVGSSVGSMCIYKVCVYI